MNIQLKGFTFSRRINIKNDNDFVLLFRNDEGNFKIVAWTMDPAHSVKIDENIAKVTGSTEIDGEGKVLKLKTEQGWLALDLNALPQYITLPPGIGMN
jgi:hypothetical protein